MEDTEESNAKKAFLSTPSDNLADRLDSRVEVSNSSVGQKISQNNDERMCIQDRRCCVQSTSPCASPSHVKASEQIAHNSPTAEVFVSANEECVIEEWWQTTIASASACVNSGRTDGDNIFALEGAVSMQLDDQSWEESDSSNDEVDYEMHECVSITLVNSYINEMRQKFSKALLSTNFFPSNNLNRLFAQLLKSIRNGTDENEYAVNVLLEKGIYNTLERLLDNGWLASWKLDGQRGLWQVLETFIRIVVAKLGRMTHADFIFPYFRILAHIFFSKAKFYEITESFSGAVLNEDFELLDFSLYLSSHLGDGAALEWYRYLVFRFGELGGFDALKKFFDDNLNAGPTLESLNCWLRPFANAFAFLSEEKVQPIFNNAINLALEALRKPMSEAVTKEVSDSGELASTLYVMCQCSADKMNIAEESLSIYAKCLLVQIKYGSFAKRIAALEELNGLLLQAFAMHGKCLIFHEKLKITGIVEVLFRDNLHHLHFCERLENVFKTLLSRGFILPTNLRALWEAQQGKHDVIKRNFNNIIARCTFLFSEELQECLLDLIKERWNFSSPEDCVQLIDLIRVVASEYSKAGSLHCDPSSSRSNLVLKSSKLLWDLAHDEKLPAAIVELAMHTHYAMIEYVPNVAEFQNEYIHLCIDEIRSNSSFILPSIRYLQQLLDMLSGDGKNKRADLLKIVLEPFNMCDLLTQNLSLYLETMRTRLSEFGYRSSVNISSVVVEGRYSHDDHLKHRMAFLQYVLSEGQLCLNYDQLSEIWQSMVINSAFDFDRRFAWQAIACMQECNDIDPRAAEKFFETNVMRFRVEELNESGLACFKAFWNAVNDFPDEMLSSRDNLSSKAHDYLWQIILHGTDSVYRSAISFWVDAYSKAISRCSIKTIALPNLLVERCFEMMRENERKMKNVDATSSQESSDVVRDSCLEQLNRILEALCLFVSTCDRAFWTKKSSSLVDVTFNQCFTITVYVSGAQLQKVGQIKEEINCDESYDASNDCVRAERIRQFRGFIRERQPCSLFNKSSTGEIYQSEEFSLDVHNTMKLRHVRERVENYLKPHSLFANDEELLTLFNMGLEVGRVIRLLSHEEDGQTLIDCGIKDKSRLLLNWSDEAVIGWLNRDFISMEGDIVLPSVTIAREWDKILFLIELADYCFSFGTAVILQHVQSLLTLIPINETPINAIREMIAKRNQNIFSFEKPCLMTYNLKIFTSMLLPADFIPYESLDILVFAIDCCNAFFMLFRNRTFFCAWDLHVSGPLIVIMLILLRFMFICASFIKEGCFAHSDSITSDMGALVERCASLASELRSRSELCSAAQSWATVVYGIGSIHLGSMIMLIWGFGGKSLPLKLEEDQPATNTSYESLKNSISTVTWSDVRVKTSIYLMDVLFIMISVGNKSELLNTHEKLWQGMIGNFIFSPVESMRRNISQIVWTLLTKSSTMTEADAICVRATIKTLIEQVDMVDHDATLSHEYFSLLPRILEFSRQMELKVEGLETFLDMNLDWLYNLRHTFLSLDFSMYEQQLIGRLALCRWLIAHLDANRKTKLGSDPNGRQLLKVLVEEFLLSSSDMGSKVHLYNCTLPQIQQISTHAAISMQKKVMPDTPRSLSAGVFKFVRHTPICRSVHSVVAIYKFLRQLVEGSNANFITLANYLLDLQYSDPLPTSIEDWEYTPSLALRDVKGFVGLKNAGATCYMNSILQQMFMIEPLRDAVLNSQCNEEGEDIDSTIEDKDIFSTVFTNRSSTSTVCGDNTESDYNIVVLKALQTIFANLLGSEFHCYAPKYFWRNFRLGNSPTNVREQHDALEFCNALFDSIDEGLKRLKENPICQKLFGGTFADQKICKDCPHRYEREEPFTSISVDIRPHNNLLDSLKEYVKGDLLDNDNAYLCEVCNKKVAAIKRLCIGKLPPYLMIQLKRFEYNWNQEISQKFNDYFEFPLELNMLPFTASGLAATDRDSSDNTHDSTELNTNGGLGSERSNSADNSSQYRLRGVVVHSGQANGGHYYSYIKCGEGANTWYKFEDSEVTEFSLSTESMEKTWFGGDVTKLADTDTCFGSIFSSAGDVKEKKLKRRWWSAYILVYEQVNLCTASSSVVDGTIPLLEQISSHLKCDLVHKESDGSASISMQSRFLPPKLEALVRNKNIRSMNERVQFTTNYFKFMYDVVSTAVKNCDQLKSVAEMIDDVYFFATRLACKFLLTVAVRTTKSQRIDMLNNWFFLIRQMIHSSISSRAWLSSMVALSDEVLMLYLMLCPSNDVRSFFATLIAYILRASRNDSLQEIRPYFDASWESFPTSIRNARSISDAALTNLLLLPRKTANIFLKHQMQFFSLVLEYAHNGSEESQQLLDCGIIDFLTFIISASDFMTLTNQEYAKIIDIFSYIVRSSKFSQIPSKMQVEKSASPFHDRSLEIPESSMNLLLNEKFIMRLLERYFSTSSFENSILHGAILHMCRNNLRFSVLFVKYAGDLCLMKNELQKASVLMAAIILLVDNLADERKRHLFYGHDDYDYAGMLFALMRDENVSWKAIFICNVVTNLLVESRDSFACLSESLLENEDRIAEFKDWLQTQIQNYSVPNACKEFTSSCGTRLDVSNLHLRLDRVLKSFKCNAVMMNRSEMFGNDAGKTGSDDEHRVVNCDAVDSKNHNPDSSCSATRDYGNVTFSSLSLLDLSSSTASLPSPPPYKQHDSSSAISGSLKSPVQALPHRSSGTMQATPLENLNIFASTGIEEEDAPPSYEEIMGDRAGSD